MKTVLTLISILSLAVLAWGQPPDTLWTRRGEGYDRAALTATGDGGFLWCRIQSSGRIGLDRYDAAGNVAWSQELGFFYKCDVQPDADSGFVVLLSDNETEIVRLTSSGEELWHRYVDEAYASGFQDWIRPAPGGGYFTASSVSSWATRLAANGDTVWVRALDLPVATTPVAMWAEADTGFVIAGRQRTGTDSTVFLLTKFNGRGDPLWTRSYSGGGNAMGIIGAAPANDGSVYEVGCAPSLMRIVAAGNDQWTRDIPDLEGCVATALCPTQDGGCSVAGVFYPVEFMGTNMFAAKFDSSGRCLWTCPRFTREESMYATHIVQTSDGGYVVAAQVSEPDTVLTATGSLLVRFAPDPTAAHPSVILHPSTFILSAYPNPFNPATTLAFTLPNSGKLSLEIYDVMGRQVQTLSDGFLEAGEHSLRFDGTALPSGIYFARIQSGEFTATHKLLLLK
ncbi:MAG TPA: T9SS type A sorting domain-containing protein [bacterium]|jgi:hypothetical protein